MMKEMEVEYFIIKMEISMMVNGKKEKKMEKEFIIGMMVLNMMVNGKMI